MIKMTILYGHPTQPEDFERYYAQTHLPMAAKVQGIGRLELTKFGPGPDGSRPPFYRMAELYFPSESHMQASLGSPEGQAAVADLNNFATGGFTTILGTVHE